MSQAQATNAPVKINPFAVQGAVDPTASSSGGGSDKEYLPIPSVKDGSSYPAKIIDLVLGIGKQYQADHITFQEVKVRYAVYFSPSMIDGFKQDMKPEDFEKLHIRMLDPEKGEGNGGFRVYVESKFMELDLRRPFRNKATNELIQTKIVSRINAGLAPFNKFDIEFKGQFGYDYTTDDSKGEHALVLSESFDLYKKLPSKKREEIKKANDGKISAKESFVRVEDETVRYNTGNLRGIVIEGVPTCGLWGALTLKPNENNPAYNTTDTHSFSPLDRDRFAMLRSNGVEIREDILAALDNTFVPSNGVIPESDEGAEEELAI